MLAPAGLTATRRIDPDSLQRVARLGRFISMAAGLGEEEVLARKLAYPMQTQHAGSAARPSPGNSEPFR
jgi:hypothetical protein